MPGDFYPACDSRKDIVFIGYDTGVIPFLDEIWKELPVQTVTVWQERD